MNRNRTFLLHRLPALSQRGGGRLAPWLATGAVVAALAAFAVPRQPGAAPAPGAGPALAAIVVQPAGSAAGASVDGVVEAVRQTVVAAQVAGAIVELRVRAGDRVQAGDVLLRIDARAAEQAASAGDAQVRAAQAAGEVAARDFDRQRQLHAQGFISRAALDRAEAEHKARQAESQAQLAQAALTRTQSGWHVVRAPYAGVVAELPVALGDMAMPGRPLLTLYDPQALRVTATVPQSALALKLPAEGLSLEFPGLPPERRVMASGRVQLLPTVDPATHTLQLRAELPAGTLLAPGLFARIQLPGAGAAGSPWVPVTAVVRRAELTAVYVLDDAGRPQLRQVRLGRTQADRIEVLAGLGSGERIAADPQAAARVQ